MSIQGTLRFADEDFIEDCRLSAIPDHVLELGRCVCGRIAKLSGGLCSECADPLPEDDEAGTDMGHVVAFPLIFALLIILARVHDKRRGRDIFERRKS